MHFHKAIPIKVFRYLCLLTALANAGGNLGMLLFYKPILNLVGAPLPKDLYSFAFVCGFSFTVGVLAFMVFLSPQKTIPLLVVGMVGKAIYAFFSFYFYFHGELHPFFMIFGWWDAVYSVIFFFFLIRLVSADLTPLNQGEILEGVDRPRTNKALLIYFSMSGNGSRAMKRVREGLESRGYTVNEKMCESHETLFHFPFSLMVFIRITLRAIFRVPTTIKPLDIPDNHPYDLVVVESQTWLVGMSAPVEAVFQDPKNRGIFAGRDVAAVNVCRGLWQRPQAQVIRWLQSAGGHVVGARAYENPGHEPIRCWSLFVFFAAGAPGKPAFLKGILTPQYITPEAERELVSFGQALAERKKMVTPGVPLSLATQGAAAPAVGA
jgi:flavodoxin